MNGQFVAITPIGIVVAIAIVAAVIATLYWMLHPPVTRADRAALDAANVLEEMVGSIIVVFSADIHSEHMMVLAARLARRNKADLLALYAVEVPMILREDAATPEDDRAGFDVLATAETIAQKAGVHCRTELVHARSISQGVLETAKREGAHLLVLGSYREGKYTGAPLGRAIDHIASNARCDVLIGIQGQHGSLLTTRTTPEPTVA